MKTATIQNSTAHTAGAFTPGPWSADKWAPGYSVSAPASQYTICSLVGCNNDAANARLIASAPELLAALKAIVAALSQPVQSTDISEADRSRLAGVVQILRGDAFFAVNAARSAIAQATKTEVGT